jgi:ribosomal protein L11 methyltransferase
MNYTEVIFEFSHLEPWREILIAYLAEEGFESFEDTDAGMKAYIPTTHFDEMKLKQRCGDVQVDVSYSFKDIEDENWNEKWETNFQAVVIDKSCGIRASFHDPLDVEHEVIITPKMSFGTGHHATTSGMMRQMLSVDFQRKRVLDMGCGTAVLAILAEKLGAKEVLAIDIEEWAFNNSKENMEVNGSKNIEVDQGGAEKIRGTFDVILANINRNVLLQDMQLYGQHLKDGGTILFSGFYQEDLALIKDEASKHNLTFQSHQHKDNWVTAQFQKITL